MLASNGAFVCYEGALACVVGLAWSSLALYLFGFPLAPSTCVRRAMLRHACTNTLRELLLVAGAELAVRTRAQLRAWWRCNRQQRAGDASGSVGDDGAHAATARC